MSHEIRAWATLAALVIGTISALLQWHSSVDATRAQTRLARDEQRAAFRLEAARIVMEQDSCKSAAAREALLVKLFPTLKAEFKKQIVPLFDCQPPSKLPFDLSNWANLKPVKSATFLFPPNTKFVFPKQLKKP